MTKLIRWALAAAGVALAATGVVQVAQRDTRFSQRGEAEEREQGRPPVDGDYWAIRLGYAGDPKRLHFEPAWLLDAARQDRQIASAVPGGSKAVPE